MTNTIGDVDYRYGPGPSITEPCIACKMRCNGCGVKIQFPVIARRVGEDLMVFMQRVQGMAGLVHSQARPACNYQTCDLQLPLEEGSKELGAAVKQ